MMERIPTPDILGDVLGAAPTAPQHVPYSRIRVDGGTQMRAGLDPTTVAEYAEAMLTATGWGSFPPVVVFHDGNEYWLADGFHRMAAARSVNFHGHGWSIAADIRAGTRRDAILYAAQANANHGLRRTNADKQRAVEVLLRDPEWSQWSDREIARRCAVSDRMVNKLRAQWNEIVRHLDVNKPRKKLTANLSQSTAIQPAQKLTANLSQSTAIQPAKTTNDAPSSTASAAPPAPILRRGADGRTINTTNIGQRAKMRYADVAVARATSAVPAAAEPQRPPTIGLAAWELMGETLMGGTLMQENSHLLNDLAFYDGEQQVRIVEMLKDGTVGTVASAAATLTTAPAPVSALALTDTKTQRQTTLQRLLHVYQAALDELNQFGELTGHFTWVAPTRRALEPIVTTLQKGAFKMG
jgi:hypothetical protein